MITHAHTLAAQATHYTALEQRRSLTRRPCSSFTCECTGVFRKPALIGFKALPVDIARVHARHDELPVGPGNLDGSGAAGWHLARARAAIHECPPISCIMHNLHNASVPSPPPQSV